MKSESVSFINSQGLQLDARLDRPDAQDVRAWVIFAHRSICTLIWFMESSKSLKSSDSCTSPLCFKSVRMVSMRVCSDFMI